MPRILTAYIRRELYAPFFLGLSVFLFVLFANRLVKLLELVFAKGASLPYVAKLMLTLLPAFLVYAIPMAFILAILLGYGRLSADSEITAMRAGGYSLWGLTRPAFEIGLVLALICILLSVWALPWGRHQFAIEVYRLASNQISVGLQERIFNHLGNGLMLYADRIDQGNLKNVLVSDTRDPSATLQVFAESGRLKTDDGDPVLDLDLQAGRLVAGGPATDVSRVVDFDSLSMHVDLRAGLPTRNYYNLNEMNLGQLHSELKQRRKDSKDTHQVWLELYKKFTFPIGCIIFPFLGVPLAMTNRRSGRSQGFVTALVIIAAYYMLYTTGQSAVKDKVLPPFVGAWLADFVLALAAFWIYRRAAADKPIIPKLSR